ncbi:MAG: hypothetical protein E6G09_08180 [Actinobacteria bacterium]|nr:MAG: hypothetical protein E6G09_08180 [Actinomycetota bacterium]
MRLGVVLEAFLDRTLDDTLDFVARGAPQITDLEIGVGGFAPTPHCDVAVAARPDRPATLDRPPRESRLPRLCAERGGVPVRSGPRQGSSARQGSSERSPDRGAAGGQPRRDGGMSARRTGRSYGALRRGWVVAVPGRRPRAPVGRRARPLLERGRRVRASRAPGAGDLHRAPSGNVCVQRRVLRAVRGDRAQPRPEPSLLAADGPPLEIVGALSRVGHAHAKDVVFNPGALALNGLLDRRWTATEASAPWTFATVGRGHAADWWRSFVTALAERGVESISIEHEDPTMSAEDDVAEGVRCLVDALDPQTPVDVVERVG